MKGKVKEQENRERERHYLRTPVRRVKKGTKQKNKHHPNKRTIRDLSTVGFNRSACLDKILTGVHLGYFHGQRMKGIGGEKSMSEQLR